VTGGTKGTLHNRRILKNCDKPAAWATSRRALTQAAVTPQKKNIEWKRREREVWRNGAERIPYWGLGWQRAATDDAEWTGEVFL